MRQEIKIIGVINKLWQLFIFTEKGSGYKIIFNGAKHQQIDHKLNL